MDSKGSKWTEEDIEFMRLNWETMTDEALGAHLDRTKESVSGKRKSMKLNRKRTNSWTKYMDELLLINFNNGLNDDEIGKIINKSKLAVKNRRFNLGIVKHSNEKWKNNEILILKELYPIENIKYISETLNRTPEAIMSKANKMGLENKKCWNISKVENFVLTNSGCKLKSNTFINTTSKMKFICECGEEFTTTFRTFNHGNKRQCDICTSNNMSEKFSITFAEVKEYIESKGRIIKTKCDEFKNSKTKITILCSCGELFITDFSSFKIKNKTTCNKCSFENSAAIQRKTHEEFLYKLLKERPDFLDDYDILSEYKGSKEPIDILHKKCGKVWKVISSDLYLPKANNCGHCSSSKKKTHEEFVNVVYELVGHEYTVVGEYINSETHVLIKHNDCGHTWGVSPSKFIGNESTRCPQCCINSRVTYPILLDRCKKVNAHLLTTEKEYGIVKDNLKFKCECGAIYERTITNIEKGYACCKECSLIIKGANRAKKHDEFLEDLKDVFNVHEYTFIDKYHRIATPIRVRHDTCGCIFDLTPSTALHKDYKGCPQCYASTAERKMNEFLTNNGLIFKKDFDREVSFEGLNGDIYKLRFDFVIYMNGKISKIYELDGQMHFIDVFGGLEKQQKYDKLKNEFCEKNNYELVRIPYWDFDKIEDILQRGLKDIISERRENDEE